MSALALDSSACVRWVIQEQGWGDVDVYVQNSAVDIVLPGPVITETIAIARDRGNASSSQTLLTSLLAIGMKIEIAGPDDHLKAADLLVMSKLHRETRTVMGRPKTYTRSLGDALILAVCGRLGIPILTRDLHWTWLAEQGLIDVDVHQL